MRSRGGEGTNRGLCDRLGQVVRSKSLDFGLWDWELTGGVLLDTTLWVLLVWVFLSWPSFFSPLRYDDFGRKEPQVFLEYCIPELDLKMSISNAGKFQSIVTKVSAFIRC